MRTYTLILAGDCYIESIDQDTDIDRLIARCDADPWSNPSPWLMRDCGSATEAKSLSPGLYVVGNSAEQKYNLYIADVDGDRP